MRRRLCPKEALFTPSFIAVCSANLLFFIASFMMVPVLPIYLLDGLHASKSVVGIILSAYMIGALVMRPLSGFLADQFPRKILFLVCGILFAAQFEGYLLFNALALVGIVRALHGMSFGALSTSAATLAVDVIPIAKLGTGIGLYGMMGSLAMALGPMIGMLVLEAGSYDARHGQRHLPHRVGRGHRRGRAPRRAHRGNIQLRRRVHPRPDHAVLLRRAVYEGHRPAIREKQAALRIPSSARPP